MIDSNCFLVNRTVSRALWGELFLGCKLFILRLFHALYSLTARFCVFSLINFSRARGKRRGRGAAGGYKPGAYPTLQWGDGPGQDRDWMRSAWNHCALDARNSLQIGGIDLRIVSSDFEKKWVPVGLWGGDA